MPKQTQKIISALSLGALLSLTAHAEVSFIHTLEGTPLDLSNAKKIDPTQAIASGAFESFKQNASNPYNCNAKAVKHGHDLFLSACSGCHGHHAEGKLGPGLADDYWTYPQNATDKGLFETLFGGAQGMMGPQYLNLNPDEMLQIMAWIRSIYQGAAKKAKWLRHPAACANPVAATPEIK